MVLYSGKDRIDGLGGFGLGIGLILKPGHIGFYFLAECRNCSREEGNEEGQFFHDG